MISCHYGMPNFPPIFSGLLRLWLLCLANLAATRLSWIAQRQTPPSMRNVAWFARAYRWWAGQDGWLEGFCLGMAILCLRTTTTVFPWSHSMCWRPAGSFLEYISAPVSLLFSHIHACDVGSEQGAVSDWGAWTTVKFKIRVCLAVRWFKK